MASPLLVLLFAAGIAAAPDQAALLAGAVRHADQYYAKIAADPIKPVGSRDLFAAALAYATADQHLDRLERLFAVAASLQDRNPDSRSYGNFRWHSAAAQVDDYNAVDFCMQPAAILQLEHRDRMPGGARALFDELLRHGVEGLVRHRVAPSYTNIALMNAGNLILLGEGLERPEIAVEGRARLDRIVLDIWEHGIHEYGSPTYYGVDLQDLAVLESRTRDDQTRRTARALLELFWSDIAANWHLGADKYTGARSRDYDYLSGLGILDLNLWVEGWLTDGALKPGLGTLLPMLAGWHPPARLEELRHAYPRLVRQRWGAGTSDARTHYLLPDVALGTASRTYGNMDIPLAVDFAGPRRGVRAYFIADGRHDPYGKRKVPSGGGHDKTIHLTPMWTAAQAGGDALGLVVYRPNDIPEGTLSLESHIVLPRQLDELYVGEQRVRPGGRFECEVPAGTLVALRRGSAAAGFRLLWSRDCAGAAARTTLVDDGNTFGALRLTSAHGLGAGPFPAAAYWVRVGSAMDEGAFAAWRQDFAGAQPVVRVADDSIAISAAGLAGDMVLEAAAPFEQAGRLLPAPATGILELNGQEIGRRLLQPLGVVAAWQREEARLEPLDVSASGAAWEAEDGLIRPPMVRAEQQRVGFVWEPGLPGERGGGSGAAIFRLRLPQPGTWYLWGRVEAPTPDDDSFSVRITAGGTELLATTTWATGVRPEWSWVPLAERGGPTALKLPAGLVDLQVLVRENGTRLDRLWLGPSTSPP